MDRFLSSARRRGLMMLLGLSLVAGGIPAARAQVARTNVPLRAVAPVRRTLPPAAPGVPPAAGGQPDQFDQMVNASASLDLESPVTARAEFDPPTAALGQRITFRLVLSALEESVEKRERLAGPPGLELLAGGRAQSYQPGPAGRLQPQTTLNFRAMPAAPGEYVIPAFTLKAYGKDVTVPAARLVVTPRGAAGGPEAPHLLLELPAGEVYAGQTFRAGILLPDPGDGSLQGLISPVIVGEGVFVEPGVGGQRHEVVQREGRSFPAFVQDLVVTAVREGRQKLVAQASTYGRRSLPGQPAGMSFGQVLVDSDPWELVVRPLPKEGVPAGFAGAVGGYRVDAPVLSTNQLTAGEVLILTLRVRGEGNLGRLNPPKLPAQREWMSYPPITEAVPPAAALQRGYTTFSYTLIPLTDRVKATPAIPFSAFDPRQQAYVDLTVPPVPVTVLPAAGGAAALAARAESAGGGDDPVREREPVLSGLAERPGAAVGGLRPAQERPWFWAAQLLPAAALAGTWGWARRRRYLAAHPEIARRRRARRGWRREWLRARRAGAARDAAAFVAGGINALREVCAPHTAANPESLVCADILRALPDSARQGASAELVRRLFAAGDSLRYGGPSGEAAELLGRQAELAQLLAELGGRL